MRGSFRTYIQSPTLQNSANMIHSEEEETDEVFQFPLTLKPKKGTGSGAATPTLEKANGTN